MLSRLIPKPIHFRRLFSLPPKPYLSNSPTNPKFTTTPKFFSTNNNNGNNNKNPFSPNAWKDFRESEEKFDAFFAEDNGETLTVVNEDGTGVAPAETGKEEQLWLQEKGGIDNEDADAIFKGIDKESEEKSNVGGNIGMGAEYLTPWSMKDEEDKIVDVFNFQEGDDVKEVNDGFNARDVEESGRKEEIDKLESEEKELTAVLKGPTRAFGDLIASSGITDEMIDSLIALKDFEGVEGLPPLSVIEDLRYENNTRKSSRGEMERLKQEEAAKARVRQVDEKGRAYGTGRRKCSVARVWVQPGDGKFTVNDKEFDVYFPMLEHRATLLRPFSETKTLGLWDVKCTVKGGGVSGQVGAIRLGISKAMQSWEPDLRPALRNAGFLTRDARVVERKKPGKAKARKSYQWVKR
ncbi:putative ribosomal protein S9 [Lupinus albus]|uniref:Putative ribosomal protein S9 n=1 Tax=Lupinus albus TaxID=3870 RepID=A0A6A4NW84_LUPAL|nr:putative ribosomal protein S9 [Lupinus albus]